MAIRTLNTDWKPDGAAPVRWGTSINSSAAVASGNRRVSLDYTTTAAPGSNEILQFSLILPFLSVCNSLCIAHLITSPRATIMALQLPGNELLGSYLQMGAGGCLSLMHNACFAVRHDPYQISMLRTRGLTRGLKTQTRKLKTDHGAKTTESA